MPKETITIPVKSVRIRPLYLDCERITITADLPSPKGLSIPLIFWIDTYRGKGEEYVRDVLGIKKYELIT